MIVAVSADEFNLTKNKTAIIPCKDRMEIIDALKCVDLVVPEYSWQQKTDDIKKYDVSIFGMGDDWSGHFDFLKDICQVVYLPRTKNISSTALKSNLKKTDIVLELTE